MCPRVLPPKTSVQGCLSPSLYHPDLVLIPQIIRVHSFSEAYVPSTGVPWSRSNPLSTRPTFHPSSLLPLQPGHGHALLYPPPHTEVSGRSHPTPRRQPASLCGCSRQGARIPIPVSPSRTSPRPACRVLSRRAVLHSLQVVPLDPRQSHFSPALPIPSAPDPGGHRFQIGQEARRGARHRGQQPGSQLSRALAAPPAC